MSKSVEQFEAFWRQMDLKARPRYIHPADEAILTDSVADKAQLQLQLLPLPVNGNLRRAEIIVLMLNSGWGEDDAAWEEAFPNEHAAMLSAKRANLHQSHGTGDAYPFYDLNPRFQDHPGAAYWKGGANLVKPRRKPQEKRLAELAGALAVEWSVPLSAVYRELSNRIAVVQRCAYASKDGDELKTIAKRLDSSAELIKFIRGLVDEDEKLVVVVRAASVVGLLPADNARNLFVYEPQGPARFARMGMRPGEGGPVMFERLRGHRPFDA